MGWEDRAACKDQPTTMFVGERMSPLAIARAKAYCNICPVRVECLEYCLSAPGWDGRGYLLIGVWGGTSDEERRDPETALAIAARTRPPTRSPYVEGTRARHGREHAYEAHGCRCDLCSTAARERWRERRQRQRFGLQKKLGEAS